MAFVASVAMMFLAMRSHAWRASSFRSFSRSRIVMMPEGPEVSSMVDSFHSTFEDTGTRKLTDWTLTDIKIHSGRYLDSPPQDIETLKQSLPLPIVDINSKGKFTYFKLSKASIWSTLGLKGWWKFGEIQRDPRFQFVFETNDGLSTRTLTYYDKIGYGTLKISLTDKELEDKLESLGVCWIRDKPNFDEFMKVVRKSKASSRRYLAVFLMDQSKTAGIGNYILSEVLYKSFIYPWAKVGDLDEDDWIRLYDAIVDIISESYEAQSPKFKGSHFDYEFKVYGRAICPRGHVVKKEVGPHKRSVHWVQAVQVRCKPDTNLE